VDAWGQRSVRPLSACHWEEERTFALRKTFQNSIPTAVTEAEVLKKAVAIDTPVDLEI